MGSSCSGKVPCPNPKLLCRVKRGSRVIIKGTIKGFRCLEVMGSSMVKALGLGGLRGLGLRGFGFIGFQGSVFQG